MKLSTRSGPELRGANIDLDKILAPIDISQRQTKIVCTLGPSCWDIETLCQLIDKGMSVARFNFSHGDHAGHKECLDRLRQAAAIKKKNIGKCSFLVSSSKTSTVQATAVGFSVCPPCFTTSRHPPTSAVALDTKGPEIRSGFFADGAKKITLVKDQTLILTSDYEFKGNSEKLACSYGSLAKSVKPGQAILVADGSLVLTVLSVDEAAGEVSCRVENNVSIGERKNMNLPGVIVDLPTLTDKDIKDIVEWGIPNNIDFIFASFVRKASDVEKIREVLGPDHQGVKIICKIENQEGMQNYDAILEATDGIMVARGDVSIVLKAEQVIPTVSMIATI